MKIIHKAIIEEPGPIWDIHKDNLMKKIDLDTDGSFSVGKEKFFVSTIRRTRPYKVFPFFPWSKAQDEIYFCASGIPTSVPPLHEFKEMTKIAEYAQFSSQQMELLAREKETGMYLHQGSQWLWFLAGGGLFGMIAAIAMYALTKWQG